MALALFRRAKAAELASDKAADVKLEQWEFELREPPPEVADYEPSDVEMAEDAQAWHEAAAQLGALRHAGTPSP